MNIATEPITVGTHYSGIGALIQAMMRTGLSFQEVIAVEKDPFARKSYIENYGNDFDRLLMSMESKKCFVDPRLYSFLYQHNVYGAQIPSKPLQLYVTTPPCQAFSIAGDRKGKADRRGILFLNSHEFIQKNKPRYFIFENVKGLLSHDKPKGSKSKYGHTFDEWIRLLGGKSVNGNPMLFPDEDSVPYHIYWKVMQATEHGVPQNRERVFIVGIRDDEDNNFQFAKPRTLEKRLIDVLESNVDQKYHLSEEMISFLMKHKDEQAVQGNGFGAASYKDVDSIANCLRANGALCPTDNILRIKQISPLLESGGKQPYQQNRVYDASGVAPALLRDKSDLLVRIYQRSRGANSGGFYDVAPTVTSSRYEQNNFLVIPPPQRVFRALYFSTCGDCGKRYVDNLRRRCTGCNQLCGGVTNQIVLPSIEASNTAREIVHRIKVNSGVKSGFETAGAYDSINTQFPNSTTRKGRLGKQVSQTLDTGNHMAVCIPVLSPDRPNKRQNGRRFKNDGDPSFTLTAQDRHGIYDGYIIRRLTPRESHRLMDFPDTYKIVVSDSQAYRQAGNSVVVQHYVDIIRTLFKDQLPLN